MNLTEKGTLSLGWGGVGDGQPIRTRRVNHAAPLRNIPCRLCLPLEPVYCTHLGRCDLDVNNDGGQRSFRELGWVVDGVSVQGDQLQGPGQLEDPLNLTLYLSWPWSQGRGS